MVRFGNPFLLDGDGSLGPRILNGLDPPLQSESMHGRFVTGTQPAKPAALNQTFSHFLTQNYAKECKLPGYFMSKADKDMSGSHL